MKHTYSVIPMFEDHFDEIVKDTVEQYRKNITSMPILMIHLLPEGDPVVDKAEYYANLYARYRDALLKEGVPSGIMVQDAFGHGWLSNPTPYQKMLGFKNGKVENAYCPEDERTVSYLANALRRIAMEHPKVIMLDDDVRLLIRPFEGCACPLHMKKLNDICGTSFDRDSLYEYVISHPNDDPITLAFVKTQRDSLVNAVTKFREAIDSVDPTIQGINCTSGEECDSAVYINPIFAGKNNPTIVRAANGTYAPRGTRNFSDTMQRAAMAVARMKRGGIDFVLSETDTVPQNRYAKGARFLHTHFTSSLLEGCYGAKHWLTRMPTYEPKSGVEYRNILAKHDKFYDEISRLSDGIKWVGANAFFKVRDIHLFHSAEYKRPLRSNAWGHCFFERVGIPYFFSDENSTVAFLEGNQVDDLTDADINKLFEKSVVLSYDVATELQKRGYGSLLGVKIEEFEGTIPPGQEVYEPSIFGTERRSSRQQCMRRLVPTSDSLEVISYNSRKVGNDYTVFLSPAVTLYRRENGAFTVVFSGTPNADFTYYEAFSFFNDSRREEIIYILKEAGELDVCLDTDNEICLRAGYVKSGELMCTLINLGYDPEEEIKIYFKNTPKSARILRPDGSYENVEITSLGDSYYSIKECVEPMYPVVILFDF